jgi:RNA polymerase sigma-70 factor, ECF subfamily
VGGLGGPAAPAAQFSGCQNLESICSTWRFCCGHAALVPILGAVFGEEFPAVLAAAQHGSEPAFTRLWLDANPALVRYLRVIAPESADDVASDTWVQVVRGLRRFRGDEAAWRAWLFTTARRRVIDASRRRSRRREESLDDVPAAMLPVTADAADEAMERLGTRSAIMLLTRLPRLQAEVVLLRVVAGLDTEAVARLLGRSPGAVRVAGHRGLRRLAEILAEAGVTL